MPCQPYCHRVSEFRQDLAASVELVPFPSPCAVSAQSDTSKGQTRKEKMQGGVRTSLEPHRLSTATLQTTGHSFPSTKFYWMGKNNKISLISQQGLCLGAVTSCLHCLGPERLSSRSKPRAVQKWLWFSWWSQEGITPRRRAAQPLFAMLLDSPTALPG